MQEAKVEVKEWHKPKIKKLEKTDLKQPEMIFPLQQGKDLW
ncbi:MAG: hypothetical protein ACFFDI_17030 [Promethearchaeota archaeon]